MAITKDIVILDIREAAGGLSSLRFAIWLQIGAPYPNTGATSAYPDINSDNNVGPAGQNIPGALTAGQVIEELYSITVPTSLISGANWANVVEPYILAILNARKAYRSGTAPAALDPGVKYKILHDQTTGWSA